MKKSTKTMLVCGAIFLFLCTAGTAVISVFTLTQLTSLSEAVSSEMSTEEEETQENDVVIADEYVIKDTLRISDAYKSGDTSELDDKDKETLDMAKEVIEAEIKDGMTDYEKELAIYKWMTTELQPDQGLLVVIPTTQEDCDNPYGVLKYHNAVCVGYATTFRMFMQMMDIECMVVHNAENFHSWDLIKLDEQWYHTDIYSDAGTSNYANFNMNDAMCSTSHDWDTSFFPKASGTKYNYAIMNKADLDDIYTLPEKVKKAIDDGKDTLSFAICGKNVENDAAVCEEIMIRIEGYVGYSSETDMPVISHYWTLNDAEYVLCVFIAKYDNQEKNNLTEEEYEKIDEACTKAFGEMDYDYSEGGYGEITDPSQKSLYDSKG